MTLDDIERLQERITELEDRVRELESLTARRLDTDTEIRVGDTVEENATGDRGVVTGIVKSDDSLLEDKIYSHWDGGYGISDRGVYVLRHECHKVRV